MPEGGESGPQVVRAAEVVGSLCLATDLGTELPLEHGLHSTVVAMWLADRLGVDADTRSQTYYACLLFYAGCTADADVVADLFGEGALAEHFAPVMFGETKEILTGVRRALVPPDSSPVMGAARSAARLPRAMVGHRRHLVALCEVAQMLTDRLDNPAHVRSLFASLTERWDGKGEPLGIRGEELPLPWRIVHVARDAVTQRLIGGDLRAATVIRARAGKAFDPVIARLAADGMPELFAFDTRESVWEETMAAEPRPWLTINGAAVDRALAAIGDFADLVSPFLLGHSSGVADLTASGGAAMGMAGADLLLARQAALVHDVGRVAVPPRIWQQAGVLSADDWERVRLHAYHSERILCHASFLAPIATIGSTHHERLDGSGYHRGSRAPELSTAARLLAAADAYHAMTEPRPHRAALTQAAAARILADEARRGRLDVDAVAAVLDSAGQPVPNVPRPAGLTEREAQVVALVARGLQTKQIARRLGISAKTADRHIQNAYGKIGISTRASAALFAMEHGLLRWGELPIAPRSRRS